MNIYDIFRIVNALLALFVVCGAIPLRNWWKSLDSDLALLALSFLGLVAVGLYGALESIYTRAGGGLRPFLVTIVLLWALTAEVQMIRRGR